MIYKFNGYIPVIDPSSYIHKEATIIGNVIIGKDVYVGASLVVEWPVLFAITKSLETLVVK